MYEIGQFLYQVGVLISRGSLEFMKFKITGTITVLQAVVFAAFLCFCLLWKTVSIWIVFPATLACGLLGGWGYLFSVYRLMDNKRITSRNKEILLNVLMIFADTGALFASLFVLLLDNTIMKV